MSSSSSRFRFEHRLLAEWQRLGEEAAGHPQQDAQADAAAIAAGGDFRNRILARAAALPDGAARLRVIRRLRGFLIALATLLVVFATLSGAAVASTALGASRPASLPLVLLAVVGANLLLLLLWVLGQCVGGRIAQGLAALLRPLARRYARTLDGAANGQGTAPLALLTGGALGRWGAATLVHAAWLGYALGALLALAVLLSVRAYELSWSTTLLSDAALTGWARLLSVGPAWLGVAGADALPVLDAGAPGARQARSLWLLAAAAVYGVLPRALLLAGSALGLWRAQRALASDLNRPGFARLRARLLPDHASLGTVDPSPLPPPLAETLPDAIPARLRGRVHGLAVESPALDAPPPLPGVDWIWLGGVDDGASRVALLARLPTLRIEQLAVRLRATLTPDRGLERFLAALATSGGAPVTLLLGELDRLQARGTAAYAQRLAAWQVLARHCGAALQLETEQDR